MSVLRIIDANANRAREALRVMEEAARFILDDPALTSEAKQLRHDFTHIIRTLDGLQLQRDTRGDVGTEIGTDAERSRSSVAEIAIAAAKRLGEALRAIEEYGKLVDIEFASEVVRLRYRGYMLEQKLDRALIATRPRQWQVCVLLSESLCAPRSWEEVAQAVADAAPDCIQLREKELDGRQLLRRVRTLREMIRRNTTLIVNDRPDVALIAGAHGVHLGQGDLPCAEVRRLAGRRLIIGVSTSRIEQAKQALSDGADYCGVGAMFPSTTRPTQTIAGPEYLRQYLQWDRLPHLAIGGITPENVGELSQLGGRGVAVSGAVCGAEDPAAVIRTLREAMAEGAAKRPGASRAVGGKQKA